MPLLERVEVPRDLRLQPRRVLHGARGRPARPGRRRASTPAARTGCRRARRSSGSPSARASSAERHSRQWERPCQPRARRARDPRGRLRPTASGASSRRSTGSSREQIFPVLTPLGRRPGPAVPVHLEPVAVAGRVAARPGLGHRDVRAREGAEGGAAALRARSATHVFVPLESGDRAPPRRSSSPAWRSCATTSSGSRATPTSPSPTRPTTCCARSRTSCAGAASARSCGSRWRRHGPGHARVPGRAARHRGDAGDRRRRAARPRGPVGALRGRRPPRAARPALDAR